MTIISSRSNPLPYQRIKKDRDQPSEEPSRWIPKHPNPHVFLWCRFPVVSLQWVWNISRETCECDYVVVCKSVSVYVYKSVSVSMWLCVTGTTSVSELCLRVGVSLSLWWGGVCVGECKCVWKLTTHNNVVLSFSTKRLSSSYNFVQGHWYNFFLIERNLEISCTSTGPRRDERWG